MIIPDPLQYAKEKMKREKGRPLPVSSATVPLQGGLRARALTERKSKEIPMILI